MRFRLGLSLGLVVILIAGSLWIRLGHAQKDSASLVQVGENEQNFKNAEVAAQAYADLALATGSSTATQENLTGTDLIARQMLSDYINLSMNGQATDEQISALAENYTENIASLDNAHRLTMAEIQITTDSGDTFQAYADNLSAIYAKYQNLIGSEYKDNEHSNLPAGGKVLTNFAEALAGMYDREVKELKALPAPSSLAQEHLRLINLYLSDASAFRSLSEASTDPALAFAGIIIVKKNQTEEATTLTEIEKVLTEHGI